MNQEIPPEVMSRMAACFHFFSLKTVEEKKEYGKLTEEDKKEIAEGLVKLGYSIKTT